MSRNRSINYILPEDTTVLRTATKLACARMKAATEQDGARIGETVLWLARCGYARHSDGTLDAGMLADAAVSACGLSMPAAVPSLMQGPTRADMPHSLA